MLLKVIKDKEQSYFAQNQKPITKSEMYNDYIRKENVQRNGKRYNREKDKESGEHKIKHFKERENAVGPIYTCFACATPGHVGIPCSKLAHHELFSNPLPDYLYPHDKINYVDTSKKPIMRDQATSPALGLP